jgi:hypothetical protein
MFDVDMVNILAPLLNLFTCKDAVAGVVVGPNITLKEATVLLPVNILADPICVDVVPETSAFNTKSTPQAVIIISPY